MSLLPESVIITDDTMREGLQIESAAIPVEAKLRLLDALGQTGAKVISIGSFAHPKWTPQMACIDEIAERFVPRPGVTYTAAFFNKTGFERADRWYPKLDVRRRGRSIRRLLNQSDHRAAGLRRRQPDVSILYGTLHRDERRARGDATTVVDEVGDGGRQILRGRYQQPGIAQCVQHHGERHVASGARHLSTYIRGISNCTVLPARSMVPAVAACSSRASRSSCRERAAGAFRTHRVSAVERRTPKEWSLASPEVASASKV
jgi:hypothetical protein